MKVFISINGVLRNFLQKFEYHYNDYYLNSENSEEETFEYKINNPVYNDDILKYFNFQSKEEMNNFLYVDFPIEIFGHSGLSYQNVITQLNTIIFEHKDIEFTLIGLDELGKAKPATLFFLSRNGILANNIKFIKTEDIKKTWKECDLWVTDDMKILKKCPKKKTAIKFETKFNEKFTYKNSITNLIDLIEKWLTFLTKTTTLI
jgi:hypothetical protein